VARKIGYFTVRKRSCIETMDSPCKNSGSEEFRLWTVRIFKLGGKELLKCGRAMLLYVLMQDLHGQARSWLFKAALTGRMSTMMSLNEVPSCK
jgi:hypothetical protein